MSYSGCVHFFVGGAVWLHLVKLKMSTSHEAAIPLFLCTYTGEMHAKRDLEMFSEVQQRMQQYPS